MATCNVLCFGAATLVTPAKSFSAQNLSSQRAAFSVSTMPRLPTYRANSTGDFRGQGDLRSRASSSTPGSNGKDRVDDSKKGEIVTKKQDIVSPRQQNGRGTTTRRSLSPFDLVDSFLPPRSVLLRSLLDEMDQVLDAPLFATTRSRRSPQDAKPDRTAIRTPWDVVEEEAAFFLRMDLPGFSKERVKVYVEEDSLVIKAEQSSESKDDKFASRTSSDVSSKLLLPDNVDVDNISAELKNGVLVVTVPKRTKQTKDVINVAVN